MGQRAIIASTGVEFKQARESLGISAAAVAAELGCGVADLLRYEADPAQLGERILIAWGEALANAPRESSETAEES
jgi:transcriptional regulator with XRE-family HTH domain